jgi:hypothetical protein
MRRCCTIRATGIRLALEAGRTHVSHGVELISLRRPGLTTIHRACRPPMIRPSFGGYLKRLAGAPFTALSAVSDVRQPVTDTTGVQGSILLVFPPAKHCYPKRSSAPSK